MTWVCDETLKHFQAFEKHLIGFQEQYTGRLEKQDIKYSTNLTKLFWKASEFINAEKAPNSKETDVGNALSSISGAIKTQLIEIEKKLLLKVTDPKERGILLNKFALVFESAVKFATTCTTLDISREKQQDTREFQATRREVEQKIVQLQLIDASVQQVSYFSMFKHAVRNYPRTMATSALSLTAGFSFEAVSVLDRFAGEQLNQFLHLDQMGINYKDALAVLLLLTAVIGTTVAMAKSFSKTENQDPEQGLPEERRSLVRNSQTL